MSSIVRRLLADLRAGTAIEYTLVVGLIAIVAIGAISSIGRIVVNMLGNTANALS